MPVQSVILLLYCITCTHTGNTGSYLTDTGTVYITRDGGLSWEQVDVLSSITCIFYIVMSIQ